MQPGSRLGSSESSAAKEIQANTEQVHAAAREKEPVRVDYLTALADIVNPEIYIYKEKRRLYVVQSGVMVRDYPIGLGSQPVGDKERDGDGRTPEGDFRILRKNLSSQNDKALVLSYPDRKHAELALFDGVITPSEFKEIEADAAHNAPAAYEKLGGQMSIHAGGAHKDWTRGTVALYNSDMDELFKIASTGTPVHIRP
jgi:L,D-peptidoglycan transpeptidase YkuD (ErfK/YbiS/YcfS/YnhG family)